MKEKNIFENNIDYTDEVPYMNNDGDIIQDHIKEVKKLTETLQGDFLSKNNIVQIDFTKNNDNKKN